ncbi:unnamed protein product [Cyclocybe aegerita]|uniref:RNase H type-1 domain-containing protein n=1 Tax=Cyclocybe aegerita TaxID=1973307 RepID=A0A8S0VYZ2_CYCAE|nr:unnamed protein product [Cyclocybe aegerita]
MMLLSFVDDGTILAQSKQLNDNNVGLHKAYKIIYLLFVAFALVLEHNKTELFHFCVGETPIIPRWIWGTPHIQTYWRYLGFYFDHRLPDAELNAISCAVHLAVKQANCQHIMVFTDSMGSAHKAVDPSVHSGQAFSLSWDIHGEAHKYVTELKVRVGCRKTDNSIDALRSQAAHSVLDSWSSTFQDPTYQGSEFLELHQPDGQLLQPSYLNGGPWLSTFGHSITEFARVCWCITGHAPIGAYYCHFKINEPHGCTCKAALQSRQHILFRCRDRYSVHCPRFLGDIASFMKYNPKVFGFSWDPLGVG